MSNLICRKQLPEGQHIYKGFEPRKIPLGARDDRHATAGVTIVKPIVLSSIPHTPSEASRGFFC